MRYGPHGAELVQSSPSNFAGSSTGYRSAQALRESGRATATISSSDAHARGDLDDIRAESIALDRDNCIYQAAISRLCDIIVGPGWTHQARTSDEAVNTASEKLWDEYWQGKPEVRGLDSGPDLEYMFCRHRFVDGDKLNLLHPENEHFQLIPGELIYSRQQRNSDTGLRIMDGVELDSRYRPVRYHVGRYDEWGLVRQEGEPVDASLVHYSGHRRRIDQSRGEPLMQCAFAMIHRLNDICDSEAAAWQLLSRIAVSITQKDGGRKAVKLSKVDTELTADDKVRAVADRIIEFPFTVVFNGEPGDEIKGVDRNIPGMNFVESLKMFLRLIGMPLGLSLEFMLLIWSDTNFSSGRASKIQVERNCKTHIEAQRAEMSAIRRWKFNQWVKQGRIANLPDIHAHEFEPSPYPFLDPKNEADSEEKQLQNGTITPRRVVKLHGDDFRTTVKERAEDFAVIAETVKKHNATYPDQLVTMADFTGAVRVLGVGESLAGQEEATAKTGADDANGESDNGEIPATVGEGRLK